MAKSMNEITVRRCAKPIAMIHEPVSTRAAVLLHGFSGYPGELALPAKRLFDAGLDVFVPRFPGHGTNGNDFMASNGSMWLQESERVLEESLAIYGDVSIAGHSMGGIIAVILSQRYPVRCGVLYAPALVVQGLPSALLLPASWVIKRRPHSWKSDPRFQFFDERDLDDDSFLGREYWSWEYPRQLRELDKLRRMGLKALSSVSTDLLVLTGGLDPVVPKDVGRLVVSHGIGKNNWIHLEHATHLIPYDCDQRTREMAMALTVSWIVG